MEINIKKLKNDGSTSILGTFTLKEDGSVSYEGDSVFFENVEQEGIRNNKRKSEQRLFPKDGKEFFENLVLHFRSPYLFAEEVK